MAKKRKNRTHLKGGPASGAPDAETSGPKSFVIRHGQVGASLTQLVRDFRKLMEPHTASRLKERSRNKLKDFLTIAPALGVTHLLAFTLAPIAPALHMIRLPAGPSLSFRIERYSLAKDVRAGSKHARSIGLEYLSPPLLVLASFPQPGPDTPPQLPLMMKAFQSLFPPLAPGSLALSSARRVVLVSYNVEQGTVEIRHYAIAVRPAGVSKRVRRVVEGPSARLKSASGVVDLSRERDVADYVLRQAGADGYESAASDASSAAGEDDAAAVALAQDYVGRGNKKGSRRAVRLDEIGPRLELRLVKITEGVPGREGQVIFHEFVRKSKKEVQAQKREHAEKERIRKQRREEQERNVQRKREAATENGQQPNQAADSDEGSEGAEDLAGGHDADEVDEDELQWDDDADASEGENETEPESEAEDEVPPPPKRKRR